MAGRFDWFAGLSDLATVVGALVAVAALTAIPAGIGARRPVAAIPQAEDA